MKPSHLPRFRNLFTAAALLTSFMLQPILKADTSLKEFRRDCQELSCGRQNPDSQAAKLIIRSWIKGVDSAAVFNGQSGLANSPLNTLFPEAADPAWCARSLEKFLHENAAAFPDNATAEQVLPLWWISVHPGAEAKYKDFLRISLRAMKETKHQQIPSRRFPTTGK
jgi:hypothetical protein